MNPDTPKNHVFSFFAYIQTQNEKNDDFLRGTIFPILSSPRPVFYQKIAFSSIPAEKISHKSDNTIPFLDRGTPLLFVLTINERW
tara:strand:- start:74 stop:328 length:255 start_codon:yes stop_codon:yes gene_type:complete